MTYYIFKVLTTALIVVVVSEMAKRFPVWAAVLASLPLTSVLGLVWLYIDTRDPAQVIRLSQSIFWMVFPSLIFFIVLPLLLRWGWGFFTSLFVASGTMAGLYLAFSRILHRLGAQAGWP